MPLSLGRAEECLWNSRSCDSDVGIIAEAGLSVE